MVDIPSISTGLNRAEDGIWYGSESEAVSYPSEGHNRCFDLEADSFWFRHRNACIQAVISGFPPPCGGAIFDVGGGNGYVARGLEQAGYDVVLVEPGKSGATNARRRGLKNIICASTTTAGLHTGSLPAIGLFDVIEHIESDKEFLTSMHGLLQSNGRLYATVPAYPILWSQEDIQAGHCRRYSLSQVCGTVREAGFRIDYATYIFRFLPLATLIFRTIPFRLGLTGGRDVSNISSRDHSVKHSSTRDILNRLLGPEIRHIGQKRRMRFGGSCLLVATRI